VIALPVAFRLLPSRHDPEEHSFAWGGNLLLAVVLLLVLFYFAGFTSLFFTLSILWQDGLGRSALQTGLLVLPFALGSLTTASNSFRFSRRFGRLAIVGGITAVLVGQALVLLVLRLSGTTPDIWSFVGPLLLAGLGNGLVIAPNQDFVLGSVPREQAGTAGGALNTAQRIGAAIGIAVIGTVLFGSGASSSGSGSSGSASSGSGSSGHVVAALVHSAQGATAVNLCFVAAALVCAFFLPRRLAPSDQEPSGQEQDAGPQPAHHSHEAGAGQHEASHGRRQAA
jgi:MFS family permease